MLKSKFFTFLAVVQASLACLEDVINQYLPVIEHIYILTVHWYVHLYIGMCTYTQSGVVHILYVLIGYISVLRQLGQLSQLHNLITKRKQN